MAKPNILCISGSLRVGSSNSKILTYIAEQYANKANFEIYNGLGKLPHFSPELDTDPAIDEVAIFRDKLKSADGILICTPEYAFGVPGVLKNALDWTVSSAEFTKKPLALITASSLGDKAHQSLLYTFEALDAKTHKDYQLIISFIRSKFDANGKLINKETIDSINNVSEAFLKSIK